MRVFELDEPLTTVVKARTMVTRKALLYICLLGVISCGLLVASGRKVLAQTDQSAVKTVESAQSSQSDPQATPSTQNAATEENSGGQSASATSPAKPETAQTAQQPSDGQPAEGKEQATETSAEQQSQPGAAQQVSQRPRDLRKVGWVRLLTALVVVVLSVWLGNYLARRWRMPEYATRIGVLIFAVLGSSAVVYFGWPPHRGIDLRGGVILIYQYEAPPTEPGRPTPRVDPEKIVQAISRRINPGGVKEITIRPLGERQIEVIIPEADREEVERIKRKISAAGVLEFRILANNRDHQAIIRQAMQSDDYEVRDPEGNLLAWWVPIAKGQEANFAGYTEIATRKRYDPKVDYEFTEVLVVKDPFDVTGKYLVHAAPSRDSYGRPCVAFTFNQQGGRLFQGLTSNNLPEEGQEEFTRKLGIILDGYLYSAPAIKTVITTSGIIEGRFTLEEVEDLVDILNAGSLPARLSQQPVSEKLVGPTLGRDTIRRGQLAIIVSMIVVPLFMIWYYRFAGLVASFCLFLTLLLVLAAMISIKAAFTLAGLAGLVLTVGMAVDANVIIFERMREELDRGSALRGAIRNGFARAMSAIIDANVTTLIAATVLYLIGRDQIKGFAVTLWLGVVMSMFAAIYCGRTIFDVAERRRWIKTLRMVRFITNPNFNFMRTAPMAIAVSCILIAIGLVGVFVRGSGILDIDFTGGVSVEAEFVKPIDISVVRSKLAQAGLRDLAISDVRSLDDPTPGRHFIINTSGVEQLPPDAPPDQVFAEVQKRLEECFGELLVHYHMEYELVEPRTSAAWLSHPVLVSAVFGQADQPQQENAEKPVAQEAEQAPQQAQSAPAAQDSQQQPQPSAEKTPAPRTVAKLHFSHPLTLEALEEMIRNVMEQEVAAGRLQKVLNVQITSLGDSREEAATDWQVVLPVDRAQADSLLSLVQQHVNSTPYFPSIDTVGSAVAVGTRVVAIVAVLASLIFIVGYLWVRFQGVLYGLAAVVALIHDVLITLGAIALSAFVANFLGFLLIDEFKISLSVLAAFLTIIGYSLNDTIIVFDRIREVKGKSPQLTAEIVNSSINQTLSRTILTSLTTLLVVLVLYIGGGQAIHAFTFSLLVGVIVGTYSSIFIASPILLWFSQRQTAPAGAVLQQRKAA